MFNFKFIISFSLLVFALTMISCGGGEGGEDASTNSAKKPRPKSMIQEKADPMEDVGIGPITELTLDDAIDDALAATGKDVYKKMCTACHKTTKKFIGPSPQGIFERRNPAWVMNMILNPEEMVQKNEAAKALLIEFNGSPMANQNLTEDEARAVVEYFRTL